MIGTEPIRTSTEELRWMFSAAMAGGLAWLGFAMLRATCASSPHPLLPDLHHGLPLWFGCVALFLLAGIGLAAGFVGLYADLRDQAGFLARLGMWSGVGAGLLCGLGLLVLAVGAISTVAPEIVLVPLGWMATTLLSMAALLLGLAHLRAERLVRSSGATLFLLGVALAPILFPTVRDVAVPGTLLSLQILIGLGWTGLGYRLRRDVLVPSPERSRIPAPERPVAGSIESIRDL